MRALRVEPRTQVVTAAETTADENVAERLRTEVGAKVVILERVRLANNMPVALYSSHFPLEIGSKILRENLVEEPVIGLLEQKYGIALAYADYRISAEQMDDRVAAFLGAPSAAAVLQVERSVYSPSGDVLVFEFLYYRGDKVRYRLTLTR
jgi:GntR family transcriptional regulator